MNGEQVEQQLRHAKQEQLQTFRNEILLNEIKKITSDTQSVSSDLDQAIRAKYNNIAEYVSISSFSISTINETIQNVNNYRLEIPRKRAILCKKITDYVRVILKSLDTTWSIIEKFKYKSQKEKNMYFDQYYMSIVDTLLLKVKTLHLTILVSIYDQEFVASLESVKEILEKRYLDAETTLKENTEKLKEYNYYEHEFKTLASAYKQLLDKIQSTKDDIDRIKNY